MRKFRLWLCLTLTILLTSANYAQNRNLISTKSNLAKREYTHPGSIQIDRNPSNLELTPGQLLQKYFTKGNYGEEVITNVKAHLHYWDDTNKKWLSDTERTVAYFETPDEVLKYFPFKEGIVFGPTNIYSIEGPNDHDPSALYPLSNTDDPYFDQNLNYMVERLGGHSIQDKSAFQFDFLAMATSINFRYMFASSEYPDYVGENYNDVFGFFIQEIDDNGSILEYPRNIALIDHTKGDTKENYVSINNVNGGQLLFPIYQEYEAEYKKYNLLEQYNPKRPAKNKDKFQQIPLSIDKDGYNLIIPENASEEVWGYHNSIGINGRTVPLEAVAEVTPCKRYRLTLLVANIHDNNNPSVVFLEGGSFDAGVTPKYSIPLSNGKTVESDKVYPGHEGLIEIDLGFNVPDTYTSKINYSFDNNGKEIMENSTTPSLALPNTLTFNKNTSTKEISYKIADNQSLIGNEYKIDINGFCGTGKLTEATIYVVDPNFTIAPEILCNNQAKEYNIIAEVEGGLGYFEYRILSEDNKTVIQDWQSSNSFTIKKDGNYILQVKDLAYINKVNPNLAIKSQNIQLGGGDIHVSISRKKMGDTINLIALAKWPENIVIEFNQNAMPINNVDLKHQGIINSNTLKENGTYILTFKKENSCQTNNTYYYYLTITE